MHVKIVGEDQLGATRRGKEEALTDVLPRLKMDVV
jgi:hypothetical protein